MVFHKDVPENEKLVLKRSVLGLGRVMYLDVARMLEQIKSCLRYGGASFLYALNTNTALVNISFSLSGKRQRQTERDRDRDRETERDRDRERQRQRDRDRNRRQSNRQTERDGQTDRDRDRVTDCQRQKKKDRDSLIVYISYYCPRFKTVISSANNLPPAPCYQSAAC